jgi:riboflavin synthase
MFTGIVEELGEVTAIDTRADAATVTIGCRKVAADLEHGASVAVNGVCLTVTRSYLDGEVHGTAGEVAAGGAASFPASFTADVMKETLDRSNLGGLRAGDRVNLERPVRLSDRLGGHLVQGHVDGVGTVLERTPGERWEVVRISLPGGLDRYVVEKGSITVDGVSLTVVDVAGGAEAWFSVSLIPTTLELTTLGTRRVGEPVNVEVDVMAKQVEKAVETALAARLRAELPGRVAALVADQLARGSAS